MWEKTAEIAAGHGIGLIRPEKEAEMVARHGLKLDGEAVEKRADLAARDAKWEAAALDARQAQQVNLQRGVRVWSGNVDRQWAIQTASVCLRWGHTTPASPVRSF